jgi:hypothetical protein
MLRYRVEIAIMGTPKWREIDIGFRFIKLAQANP